MSLSQFFGKRDRSRESGTNSIGAGAVKERFRYCSSLEGPVTGPAFFEAGAGFGTYNGMYLNFGFKYNLMHGKIGVGSAEAGAVKDRSKPDRSRSLKHRFQI